MTTGLESGDTGGSASGEVVEDDVSFVREDFDEPPGEQLRLLGRMFGAFIAVAADEVAHDVPHAGLGQEVEGARLLEGPAVVDEPETHLVAAAERGLAHARHRVVLDPDERHSEGKEPTALELVRDPSGVAVSEKEHHARVRLEDAAVLLADLEHEVEIGLLRRELVPISEVGFHDLVVAHGKPAFARDVVREVGADEVDGTVGDLRHRGEAVAVYDAVHETSGGFRVFGPRCLWSSGALLVSECLGLKRRGQERSEDALSVGRCCCRNLVE